VSEPTPRPLLPCPYINVIGVLVLLLLTGTLYGGFWAYRRAGELNPLPVGKAVPVWGTIVLMIEGAVSLPLNFVELPDAYQLASNIETGLALLLYYWVVFRVRGKLVAAGVPISAGFTLLFSVFYVQYEIDRWHRFNG
jgi:hypothetical protein